MPKRIYTNTSRSPSTAAVDPELLKLYEFMREWLLANADKWDIVDLLFYAYQQVSTAGAMVRLEHHVRQYKNKKTRKTHNGKKTKNIS